MRPQVISRCHCWNNTAIVSKWYNFNDFSENIERFIIIVPTTAFIIFYQSILTKLSEFLVGFDYIIFLILFFRIIYYCLSASLKIHSWFFIEYYLSKTAFIKTFYKGYSLIVGVISYRIFPHDSITKNCNKLLCSEIFPERIPNQQIV